MRTCAHSPRISSTVTSSPRSACVTCSDPGSASRRTGAASTRQARENDWRGETVASPLQACSLRGERREVAQRGQTSQCLALEAAGRARAVQVELVADRLERPRLALEAEPQLQDAPLALGQSVECLADSLLAQRLLRLVERVGRFAVGEEVSELALVIGADRLVSARPMRGRRRAPRRRAGWAGRSPRRAPPWSPRARVRPRGGVPATAELLLPLDHVHRHADRPRVVGHGALHRLPDPPRGVGRELVAAPPGRTSRLRG